MLYPIPAAMEPDILMHRLLSNNTAVTNANAHQTEHAYLMQWLALAGLSAKEPIQVIGGGVIVPIIVDKKISSMYCIPYYIFG